MAGVDPSVLRSLMGGGGGPQMVALPNSDLVKQQMDRQETIQNVNIAFSIANSESIFKHAADGSNNARTAISASLAVLATYMSGIRLNGEELFPKSDEQAADEPGTDATGTS